MVKFFCVSPCIIKGARSEFMNLCLVLKTFEMMVIFQRTMFCIIYKPHNVAYTILHYCFFAVLHICDILGRLNGNMFIFITVVLSC